MNLEVGDIAVVINKNSKFFKAGVKIVHTVDLSMDELQITDSGNLVSGKGYEVHLINDHGEISNDPRNLISMWFSADELGYL